MANVNAMFQMVLSDYSFDQVRSAFKFYLKHHSEMPAPADIVNIIERGGRPALDKAVYVSISRKEGWERTQDEWQYMHDYEQFMRTGNMASTPRREVKWYEKPCNKMPSEAGG